jgi:hypothetical protein
MASSKYESGVIMKIEKTAKSKSGGISESGASQRRCRRWHGGWRNRIEKWLAWRNQRLENIVKHQCA